MNRFLARPSLRPFERYWTATHQSIGHSHSYDSAFSFASWSPYRSLCRATVLNHYYPRRLWPPGAALNSQHLFSVTRDSTGSSPQTTIDYCDETDASLHLARNGDVSAYHLGYRIRPPSYLQSSAQSGQASLLSIPLPHQLALATFSYHQIATPLSLRSRLGSFGSANTEGPRYASQAKRHFSQNSKHVANSSTTKRLVKSLLEGSRKNVSKYLIYPFVELIQNPSVVFKWSKLLQDSIKHGWHWTKSGFKLFGANFRISLLLLKKKIKGQPLSFREHKLLVRTTSDLIKLVPFSFFVVVPFAELLLPIALWLFPGMLPSTFSEKQIDRPQLQRKLKAKQELTHFFQEMVSERTRQVLEKTTSERSRDRAQMLKEFQEKLILKAEEEAKYNGDNGEAEKLTAGSQVEINPFLSLKDTLTYAKLFKEEFRMENMPTKALMVLCRMLGLQPYEIRTNVILQLRHYILRLQREDREILWEGVDSLTHEELTEACKERAMRFYGVSDEMMRDQMRQWLELSSHKDIPPLLLLWSRSITITHSSIAAATADQGPEEARKMEYDQQEPISTAPTLEVSRTVGADRPVVSPSVLTPAAVMGTDELLPVVEDKEKPLEIKIEEERKERQEELKAKLEEVDKRLEELRSAAEILQKKESQAGSTTPEILKESESVLRTDKPGEELIDKAQQLEVEEPELAQSQIDRVRLAKEELLRRCQRLECEMSVMREISDLQYSQVNTMVKTLAGAIDGYRKKERKLDQPMDAQKETAYFVCRVEELLKSFEESVSELSEKLENAKCIRLSTEDEVFYPDSEDSDELHEDKSIATKCSTSNKPDSNNKV